MLEIMLAESERARAYVAAFGQTGVVPPPGFLESSRRVFGEELGLEEAVGRIVSDVHSHGDDALFRYARAIDGFELDAGNVRVRPEEVERARKEVDPAFMRSARRARSAIETYQSALLPAEIETGGAIRSSAAWRPLGRAGVYVPGGKAIYPSSLLMCAVPARVAGVKEIVVATPPDRSGRVAPEILALAAELEIREVYRLGGAQAIAALAFGTRSVPRVDKVVGPGNVFVTLAKRLVFGDCDIDLLAGPSEVVVVADETARPRWVAHDLLAQAEHDQAARPVLLTDSEGLARSVAEEIDTALDALGRKDIARAALSNGAAIVAASIDEAIYLANALAPEHLEIHTRSPRELLPRVKTAGAVFLGPYAPESVGDYVAGPSHVLPTGGTGRFASGLSSLSFIRRMSVIECDEEGLRGSVEDIRVLGTTEGLDAHVRSAEVRFEE